MLLLRICGLVLIRFPRQVSATGAPPPQRMPRNRTRSRQRDAIFREQLSRNEQFFRPAGQRAVERASVVVVGLGGVGSHAAHMLARAGVARLRLVDFDQVTLSSLNRHAVATRADVGLTKVAACQRHFARFNPRCRVEAVARMFTAEAAHELLLGPCPRGSNSHDSDHHDHDDHDDDTDDAADPSSSSSSSSASIRSLRPDYVIDAIDDAQTKADLVAFCLAHKLRLICSLAAGGKSDPTRIRIGDLADPMRDPLARKLRATLRKDSVWSWLDEGPSKDGGRRLLNRTGALPTDSAVKVVYSAQAPVCPLEPLTREQREEGAHNFGAVENFRVRVMPVLGTVPALFGMTAASFVLCELGNKRFEPLASRKMGLKAIRKVRERLKRSERDEFGVSAEEGLQVSEDDVAYLLEHVWHMRCAYSGIHLEGSRAKKMVLARWDRSRPAAVNNLVLLTEGQSEVHSRMTAETGTVPRRLLAARHGEAEEEHGDNGGDGEPTLEVLQFVEQALVAGSLNEYAFAERVKWAQEGTAKGNYGGRGGVGGSGGQAFSLAQVVLVALVAAVMAAWLSAAAAQQAAAGVSGQ